MDGKQKFTNSANESVSFKFNISTKEVDDTTGNGKIDGYSIHQFAEIQGLDGSECVKAAIFTTDPQGEGFGLEAGGKIYDKSSNAPEGTWSHEMIHTLNVLDNGYNKGGVLNSPPEGLKKSEIDEIIKNSIPQL